MAKYGKLIAVIVSILLGALGVYAGFDLKGMVCGAEVLLNAPAPAASPVAG